MSKELSILDKKVRKVDSLKITKDNKDKAIRDLNKISKEYGLGTLSKSSNVSEIKSFKKSLSERIAYDVIGLAVQEGNITMAFKYNRDFKNAKDPEVKRLAKFGEKLATAKHYSDRHLKGNEKQFLENGNVNIKGYGNLDMLTLFERTKNNKDVNKLINEVKNNNPKNEFISKELDIFDTVFQRIGITREDDIQKLKDKLISMGMDGIKDQTNYLFESLETYDSDQNTVGKYNGDETELLNARLDDMLIKLDLQKGGMRKVSKTLNKYKNR
jgi:hypothetical protein